MPVKSNWQNGEQFNASDANAVAEAVNAAYVKPGTGIPATDLSSAAQLSLGKADTAVQSVSASSITDSTTTGRAVLTSADTAAARTAIGVAYGTTAGTVVEGNDSRLTPAASAITDSTAVGRSVLTATDAAAARTAIGVAYGTGAGTVVEGNDSRVTGAEQTAQKNAANGYAGLDANGRILASLLPNSVLEYQGLYNASTNTPSLSDGVGNAGDVYRVSAAGSRNFGSGAIALEIGDYVICASDGVWQRADTTDAVSTVAGRTGDVTLTKSDVGLGNVDDTSDATKNSATASLSNKTLVSPVFSGAITPDTSTASSAGFLGTPVTSVSAAYTFALSDAGDVVLHPSSDTTARTWTIPANASVAFPVGSVLTVVNLGGVITLAITSDTLTQISTGSTGSRSVAQNGLATLIKVAATQWVVSGSGLT